MAYTKTNWVNEGPPAISADNLNNIEDGVEANDIRVTDHASRIATLETNDYTTGTDNGWSYRKYKNGTYEAWQTTTVNIARQTAYGALYRSVEQTLNLPSFNTGTDYQLLGSSNGGDFLLFNSFGASTATYFFVRTSSAAAADKAARLYIRGEYSV